MDESIVHLNDGTDVDPRALLSGAWRAIGLRSIPPGAAERLVAEAVEHLVYVARGRGTVTVAGAEVAVSAGAAMTIVRGDAAEIRAASEPIQLFVVTLDA